MGFLKNLFIPHKGNNYKANFLRHSTLFGIVLFLFLSIFALNFVNSRFPDVLGISTSITAEELLTYTNQKRQNQNIQPLSLNPELSAAALNKANDMLKNDYWAHNSPAGRTPWDFIKESGYVYVYAGENLARGFTTSSEVTEAWMNSQSHRENLLSPNYSEVGFAVVTGELQGEETVLVVEELGGRQLASAGSRGDIGMEKAGSTQPSEGIILSSGIKNKPLIDSINLTSNLSIFLVSLVIFTLILEMIILERKKIAIFARHNPDHIFFLISILMLIIILGKGIIL